MHSRSSSPRPDTYPVCVNLRVLAVARSVVRANAAVSATVIATAAVLACAACGDTTQGTAIAGDRPALPGTGTSEPTSSAAPATTSAVAPQAPPPTAQQGAADVIGPFGWGPVMIGQDPAAAGATDVFVDAPEPDDSCVEWTAVFVSALESAHVSPTVGVAALTVRSDAAVHTPEGIEIGSTADEVHAAYPEFDVADVDTPNGAVIAAPGNPAAAYRMSFDEAGTVSFLSLEAVDQDCYG